MYGPGLRVKGLGFKVNSLYEQGSDTSSVAGASPWSCLAWTTCRSVGFMIRV